MLHRSVPLVVARPLLPSSVSYARRIPWAGHQVGLDWCVEQLVIVKTQGRRISCTSNEVRHKHGVLLDNGGSAEGFDDPANHIV